MDYYYNHRAIYLDRTSHKTTCPECGRAKRFVNYVYEDGTPVADGICGRCDREQKCGYHYPPQDYFRDHRQHSSFDSWKPSRRNRPTPPPEPTPTFFDTDMALASMEHYERNRLAVFLHSCFDNLITPAEVDSILERYFVGTSNLYGGAPIFWRVDQWLNVRGGKIMGYKTDGHRTGETTWTHYQPAYKEQHPETYGKEYKLAQCYFGAHLLNEEFRSSDHHTPPIWLFESEKACLIVAMALRWVGALDTFIPMACGSCGGFNPTEENKRKRYGSTRALKGSKVVLFPDEGKFQDWHDKGLLLQGYSKEVYISPIMEASINPDPYKPQAEINEGDAFDDLILSYIKQGKSVDDMCKLIIASYGWHNTNKLV